VNRNKFFASETQWPLIKWDSRSPPIIGESSVDFLQLVRVQEIPGEGSVNFIQFIRVRETPGESSVDFLQLIRVREKLGESPTCKLPVI